MSRLRPRTVVVLGALAVLLLAATGPAPTTAWTSLGSNSTSTDPLAPVLGLITLLAWVATGWLASTVLLTAGAHLPGRAGRALAALARRLVPLAVRRTVEVTLGLTVVVGTLAAPAAASTAASAPPPAPLSLDWGGQPGSAGGPTPITAGDASSSATTTLPAGSATAPDLDWAPAAPAPEVPAPTAGPAQGNEPEPAAVVVQPGDTLWELAAADLQARTGAAPADAQVAQAWPSWWAANREVVGPDPHLLLPGTPLHAPVG